MATTNRRNSRTAAPRAEKKQPEWIEVNKGVSIKGTADRFSINWHGAVIHGCKIIPASDAYDAFISWPSFKTNDGKYVKTSYIYAEENSDEECVLFDIIDELCES